jgi:putative hydrolase of the HAD superfamily
MQGRDSMGRAAIRAITFDLWDTVFVDDSDEPMRAAQGLLPKSAERKNLVYQFLGRHEPISTEKVELAYDAVDAAFHHVWYSQNITWTVRERLSVLLKALKSDLPETEFDELIKLHEEMELEVRPDLAAGVAGAIQNLHGKYKMAVVSDAIFCPGRALRQLLAHYDILKYFEAFEFLTVIANNHYRGAELANAIELKALVSGEKQLVPAGLLKAYPNLASIALNSIENSV